MKSYKYGIVLYVFLNTLDDDEKRRKPIMKIFDAIRRVHMPLQISQDAKFLEDVKFVDEAFKKSWNDMPEGKMVAVNSIAWLIFNRRSEELKHYKFNRKSFEYMSRIGVKDRNIDSIKVLNKIEEYL